MTREKLFEFAAEKGWDQVLEVALDIHQLSEIAKKLNKREGVLQIELRAMQAMGLLALISNIAPPWWGFFICPCYTLSSGEIYFKF